MKAHGDLRPSRPAWRVSAGAALAVAAMVAGACGPGEPLRQVRGGDPAEGQRLVHIFGCIGCHHIPGQNVEPAHVGPPLDRFAERRYIAGSLVNRPENLVAWIMDPDAFESPTGMPDLQVSEPEARHIAAYLYTLWKETPPGPVDSLLLPAPRRPGPGGEGGS